MTAVNQWTNPQTIYAGEKPDATYFNTYIRDNFTALKSPPFASGSVSAVTTTSTSFVLMTGSSVSITTTGGFIVFWASGTLANNTGGAVNTVDLAIDGIQQGHATFGTTLVQPLNANYNDNLSLMMRSNDLIGGSALQAGAHTASIFWKVSAGTATATLLLYATELF